MFFRNYNELELDFIFEQTINDIIIKQNSILFLDKNIVKIPKVKLYFIFNAITDVDLLKCFDHIFLLWLLTSKKSKIKKISNRLHKGKRYYRFILRTSIDIRQWFYIFLDFLTNSFIHLLEKNDLEKYNNFNNSFFDIKNLDIFSNLRLTRNYYTGKVNDRLIIKFYNLKNRNQVLNIDYFLNLLKIKIKEKNG